MADVIDMNRRLEGEEQERYARHWKARAAEDPGWAALQIAGLLDRALAAERREESLQALIDAQGEG